MTLAVVIPWRGGQPDRERHHAFVSSRLYALLPGAVHLDADSGATPFSRAGSRNFGIDLALSVGAEVAVMCDADTIPEIEPLHAAISGAARDGLLHLPYTRFRGLSAQGSKDYLAGAPSRRCQVDLESEHSTGGVMVIAPGAWVRAGGMDERITGWGFEDSCFRIACDALLGPTVRHPGTITHLWHPPEVDTESAQWKANAALAARYTAVEGVTEAVRALVSERLTIPA